MSAAATDCASGLLNRPNCMKSLLTRMDDCASSGDERSESAGLPYAFRRHLT
jgi:hypothetical protein